MKFELELSEEDIRSALQAKVQSALRSKLSEWTLDGYVKDRINNFWREELDKLVVDAMHDYEPLKQKIAAAMEKKLRGQLHRAMADAASAE
jgi:uncharacterized membrane protein YheB (UPF0754 family)